MLVLTRKGGQSVVVGTCGGMERLVKVTVIDVGKGRVRLGFDADANVPIHRAEVWESIQGPGEPHSPKGRPATPRT